MNLNTRWYIYTLGSLETNAIVAANLKGTEIECGVPCADGRDRDMYECNNYFKIREFQNAKREGRLKIEIFMRFGNSKAMHWGLENEPSHRHGRKTKERLKQVLAHCQ